MLHAVFCAFLLDHVTLPVFWLLDLVSLMLVSLCFPRGTNVQYLNVQEHDHGLHGVGLRSNILVPVYVNEVKFPATPGATPI